MHGGRSGKSAKHALYLPATPFWISLWVALMGIPGPWFQRIQLSFDFDPKVRFQVPGCGVEAVRRTSSTAANISHVGGDWIIGRLAMRSGVWSRSARVGTVAVSAALLVGLAGCGGATDVESEAAAAPSEAADESRLALEGAVVDERPSLTDAWISNEVKGFPDYEQRVERIDEGFQFWVSSMEQLLTPGGYSEDYYDELDSYMAEGEEEGMFDRYLTDDRTDRTVVIPTLTEGDGLPGGQWGSASVEGERVYGEKVVGEPRIYFGNSALLAVDEDDEGVKRLWSELRGGFELDLENGSTATYQFYFHLDSAEGGDADELWGWSSNGGLVGVS